MSTTRTKKERFLPYRYDRLGVEFAVQTVELDGSPVENLVEADRQRVLLDRPWGEAKLDCVVTVPRTVLMAVLPEHEAGNPPIKLILALSCPDTRLRRGLELEAAVDQADGGRAFRGQVSLAKADLAGHLSIQPYLLRAEATTNAVSGFAPHEGARLAAGLEWEVQIDRGRLPEGRYLEVRMKSFAEDTLIPERDRGNVYRLETDQPAPILWLNSDHANLADVLMNEGTSGVRARLREVAYDQLAFPIWSQLLLRALHHRYADGDGEYVYPWEEGVIESLAGWMYPDKETRSARIAQLEYEREDLPLLLSRLDAALQREQEFATHLLKLIEEAVR